VRHLERSKVVRQHFDHGGDFVFLLPGGQLYFEGPLELDTDGSRFHKQDPTGQGDTSLHDAKDRPVDANRAPYFVLPCHGFCDKFGIKLGDIAAVVYKDRIEFAVFADCGPAHKLGEGSMALHRALGHETVIGRKLHNDGIDSGVITIVFPGSGKQDDPQTPGRIRQVGRFLFSSIGGSPD
jgi:hypothetical protein